MAASLRYVARPRGRAAGARRAAAAPRRMTAWLAGGCGAETCGAAPRRFAAAVVLPGLLGACAAGAAPAVTEQSFLAESYLGVETVPLDDELVNFHLAVEGATDGPRAVAAYADCAAAGYALGRGHGFARHVRTNLAREAGIWRGDAVYTVSPTVPRGLMTIDAEVAVADCAERGIPSG